MDNKDFIETIKSGDLEEVQKAIDSGAKINVEITDNYLTANRETEKQPLCEAATHGNTEIVGLLLEKGANIEARNVYKETALLKAATKGHSDTVKLLLEKGADIEARDGSGETPLLKAAINEHSDTVKFLLEKGANVDVSRGIHMSTDHMGSHYEHVPLADLVEQGLKDEMGSLVEKSAKFSVKEGKLEISNPSENADIEETIKAIGKYLEIKDLLNEKEIGVENEKVGDSSPTWAEKTLNRSIKQNYNKGK